MYRHIKKIDVICSGFVCIYSATEVWVTVHVNGCQSKCILKMRLRNLYRVELDDKGTPLKTMQTFAIRTFSSKFATHYNLQFSKIFQPFITPYRYGRVSRTPDNAYIFHTLFDISWPTSWALAKKFSPRIHYYVIAFLRVCRDFRYPSF